MEWEVRHTEYDLCHPQIPCSTYHNVNAVEVAAVLYGSTKEEQQGGAR